MRKAKRELGRERTYRDFDDAENEHGAKASKV